MTTQYLKQKIFAKSSILDTTKLTFNHKRLNKELDEAMDSDSQVIVELKDFLKKNKKDQDLRYVLNSRRGKSRLKLLLDFSHQDIEIMDLLLKAGLNPNIQDDEGKTALHYAVDYNNLENVELLLKSNAKPNLQDKDGKTPLHYASSGEENYIEIINTLLEKGAKIDIQDEHGNTPLHYAAIAGYRDIVKTLIEADGGKECIRLQNRDGDTPLHLGFYRTSDSEVEVILLENAKNLNVKNKLGLDPLLMSASFSHSDTLRSILRKEGINIQSTDNKRNTALHYAVCNSYSGNSVKTTLNTIISDSSFCEDGALSKNSALQNTNILIAEGINVNVLNKNGHTPLFFAADNKDYNVAKYLLENGADARIADNKNGYTAAYYALKQNDLEMLKLFLPSGSSSIRNNIKDVLFETRETHERITEIAQNIVEKIVPNIKIETNIEAIKTQIVEILPKNIERETYRIIQNDIVKILVNNVQNRLGALSIVDKKGNTLLHHAVRWGCGRDVLNFLVENGVDINAKNKNDVASIHIAAKYGNIDHIIFFIEKEANLNVQCNKFRQSEIEILKKNVITNGNIDAGDVINLVNDSEFKKSSPMHLASTDYSVDTLLLGGANSNIKDGRGLTPIQIAIIKACKEDLNDAEKEEAYRIIDKLALFSSTETLKSYYSKGDLNQGIKKVRELFGSALNIVQHNGKVQKTLHNVREELLLQISHGDPRIMESFRNAIAIKDEPNVPNGEVPSAHLFDYHQVGSTIEEITDISSTLYPDLTELQRENTIDSFDYKQPINSTEKTDLKNFDLSSVSDNFGLGLKDIQISTPFIPPSESVKTRFWSNPTETDKLENSKNTKNELKLTSKQREVLDRFLSAVSKAQDMFTLSKIIDGALSSGIRLNAYGEEKYSFTDLVVKQIKRLKYDNEITIDIMCKLIEKGAILNEDYIEIDEELENFKKYRENKKKASEKFFSNVYEFRRIVEDSMSQGTLNGLNIDNTTFHLEYSRDSIVDIAKVVDGTRNLGLSHGDVTFGYNIVKIGKSKVEIETKNGIRNYNDVHGDVTLTFYTSLGELKVRLYCNENIIKVEVDNQEKFKQLVEINEKIGENCQILGLPVVEAIKKSYERSEKSHSYKSIKQKVEKDVKHVMRDFKPGEIVNSSLDNVHLQKMLTNKSKTMSIASAG